MQNVLKRALVVGVFLLAAAVSPRADQNPVGPILTSPFESYLELLRQQAGIPGLSGAIVKDGQIVWERGFGFANVESRIAAAPDTPYYLGDLTQTLSAMLVLECVERRAVFLDDGVSKYAVSLPEGDATVRQVLSHTSGQGTETFKYAPEVFGLMAPVVERCTKQTFRLTLSLHLIDRAAMVDTVPGRDLRNPAVVPEGMFEPSDLARLAAVIDRAAVPYKLDKKGKPVRSDVTLVDGINPVDGVISTVRDLAQLDATLDRGVILLPETMAMAWTPVVDKDRLPLVTGLGWFVQNYHGDTLVWHFGQITNGYSGLILKVPARRLTFILLANSDGLSAPFQLAAGDVTKSLFASLFLRLFL